MPFWARMMAGVQAGLAAFRGYGRSDPAKARNANYDLLWSYYLGSWREDPLVQQWQRTEPDLYRNTHQLWRIASATVNVYAQFVYPGPLSRDGLPLPNGSLGAIPLDPQVTGGEDNARNDQLLAAFSTIMDIGQYSQFKHLRPKMAAILGDCLTEIIDDYEHGIVVPSIVDPRYVKHLDIDYAGNVKAYTIEYQVVVPQSTAYGKPQQAETYTFRKEVDGDAFRTFKDDRPFDYDGQGAVVENPYGFVPAVWDRHELVAGDDYGLSALQKTLPQQMRLNSVLSHAMDYQQKQFAAPVGVIGRAARRGQTITLPGGITGAEATADDINDARRAAAENVHLIDLTENGQFVTIDFDVGQTKEMLGLVMDSIMGENPEASVFQRLLEMTQLTAPGIERALSPVVGLVRSAQESADPQTIKLLQMETAIMGYRLNNSDIPAQIVAARPDRYNPFRPFGLESYGQGLLDCAIKPRPLFEPTQDERIASLTMMIPIIESGDPYLMAQAGIPEEEIDRITREQEQRRQEQLSAMALTTSAPDEDEAAA